jgi:hypothetical protein
MLFLAGCFRKAGCKSKGKILPDVVDTLYLHRGSFTKKKGDPETKWSGYKYIYRRNPS